MQRRQSKDCFSTASLCSCDVGASDGQLYAVNHIMLERRVAREVNFALGKVVPRVLGMTRMGGSIQAFNVWFQITGLLKAVDFAIRPLIEGMKNQCDLPRLKFTVV